MPSIDEHLAAMPRRLLPIIYVIDTSGHMRGSWIEAVNMAMRDTLEDLRGVSANNPSTELKIGVLRFATTAEWIPEYGLIYLDDYFWIDLETGGLANLGTALSKLNEKLSIDTLLTSARGIMAPVIIFISDGWSTDDWEIALSNTISSNRLFKVATKIALAIGDQADVDALSRIVAWPDGTPNEEAVIPVADTDALIKLIRVVSVTASQVCSAPRTGDNVQDQILERLKRQMGDPSARPRDDFYVGFDENNNTGNDLGDIWDECEW